jgi:hypothetical protein
MHSKSGDRSSGATFAGDRLTVHFAYQQVDALRDLRIQSADQGLALAERRNREDQGHRFGTQYGELPDQGRRLNLNRKRGRRLMAGGECGFASS